MSKEDKQVIDMANSAGERRTAEEVNESIMDAYHRIQRQLRFRRLLLHLIPALVCILAAMMTLATITSGRICVADAGWAAALEMVLGVAGGMCLAEALRG